MGGLGSRLAWGKSKILSPQTTSTKRAGGVAKVAELLPRECGALSSNASVARKSCWEVTRLCIVSI
jgi:hypothetical protein